MIIQSILIHLPQQLSGHDIKWVAAGGRKKSHVLSNNLCIISCSQDICAARRSVTPCRCKLGPGPTVRPRTKAPHPSRWRPWCGDGRWDPERNIPVGSTHLSLATKKKSPVLGEKDQPQVPFFSYSRASKSIIQYHHYPYVYHMKNWDKSQALTWWWCITSRKYQKYQNWHPLTCFDTVRNRADSPKRSLGVFPFFTSTWKTCAPPSSDVGVDHGGRLCIGARHQDQRRVQHIGLEAPSGCDPSSDSSGHHWSSIKKSQIS